MQQKLAAKIELARRYLQRAAQNRPLIVLGLAIFFVLGVSLWSRPDLNCAISFNDAGFEGRRQCVSLEKAETPEARQRGLSGRDQVALNRGMLFVFDKPERACMWMKDMKFRIDIIWLNPDKEIIKIEKNVKPDSYPATFCSDGNTKYVIEVNLGVADLAKLKLGQKLRF